MKFSSKEDIEAPIDRVFAALSQFESYERSAMRRGIAVQRVDPSAPVDVGLAWDVQFKMRGKQRDARLELVQFDHPVAMQVTSRTQGIDAVLQLDLLALSQTRTRMSVSLELTPTTLSARLFVQSLKLAKTNLTKRFKLKVADYAKDMEDRFARTS